MSNARIPTWACLGMVPLGHSPPIRCSKSPSATVPVASRPFEVHCWSVGPSPTVIHLPCSLTRLPTAFFLRVAFEQPPWSFTPPTTRRPNLNALSFKYLSTWCLVSLTLKTNQNIAAVSDSAWPHTLDARSASHSNPLLKRQIECASTSPQNLPSH